MRFRTGVFAAVSCALAAAAAPAWADFSGQTILGPLQLGSVVSGDNTASSDDNDGFTSGDHIFFIWDGGDDVWALNWLGGDLTVRMTYDTAEGDPDLFLYTPGGLDDSGNYSILNTGVDEVSMLGAPAGTYYLVVDSAAGDEAPYQLAVIPTPGAAGLLAVGALTAARRKRRTR